MRQIHPAKRGALALRAKIYQWGLENPFGRQQDCAKAMGVSTVCIGAHVKAIRAGWTPEAERFLHAA